MLNAGAGAYLSSEIANVEQSLLSAVDGPVQGLLGQSIGAAVGTSGGAVGAVASSVNAAWPAAFPILGGLGGGSVGSLLGGLGGGSLVPSFDGVVTALENGSAFPLLSGQIGTGWQTLSRDIAGLTGLGNSLAPGLPHAGASTSLAAIGSPYQTLYANTVANLQAFNTVWSANPAPFLHQFINNQIGYAQTIAAGLGYVIQNFPAVLANLPANIQAAIQALYNFNPWPYLQQIVNNQIDYAHIIATSLLNAAQDFGTGLRALPAACQAAFQALLAGDITGAVSDIAKGYVNLFVTGVDVTSTGSISIPGTSEITATVTPTGTLGDLLPILTIPGMEAQNFTNLAASRLHPGTDLAERHQRDQHGHGHVHHGGRVSEVQPFPLNPKLSLTGTFGLPVALALDALGAPVDALSASGSGATAFVDAVETGNWSGAAAALLDAPAVVTNGFLNGEMTLPLTFDVGGIPLTLNVPLNGIRVPQTPYTASVDLGSLGTLTVPVGGTPLSGLVTGLYNASGQLATEIA